MKICESGNLPAIALGVIRGPRVTGRKVMREQHYVETPFYSNVFCAEGIFSFHRKFLSYEIKTLREDAQKRIWKIVTS